jgi:hypothetical protein
VNSHEYLTVLLAVAITIGILVLDALLWSSFGIDATFSRAFDWLYKRWPITSAVLFVWIGILIGHLLPCQPSTP